MGPPSVTVYTLDEGCGCSRPTTGSAGRNELRRGLSSEYTLDEGCVRTTRLGTVHPFFLRPHRRSLHSGRGVCVPPSATSPPPSPRVRVTLWTRGVWAAPNGRKTVRPDARPEHRTDCGYTLDAGCTPVVGRRASSGRHGLPPTPNDTLWTWGVGASRRLDYFASRRVVQRCWHGPRGDHAVHSIRGFRRRA